jgi:alpha-glucosidase
MIKTEILAKNVSGYMCDFGEALQLDAQIHDGDAAEYHNRYPEEWAKVNHEAIAEIGREGEVVFFMRAGFTRAPQYTPLYWLGDQLQSWDEYDGLKSAVFSATIGGISGIALTHPDIGGYNYVSLQDWLPVSLQDWLPALKYQRTKELFFRSSEFAAFTAAFRTHDGNEKLKSWQFYSDDETLDFSVALRRFLLHGSFTEGNSWKKLLQRVIR